MYACVCLSACVDVVAATAAALSRPHSLSWAPPSLPSSFNHSLSSLGFVGLPRLWHRSILLSSWYVCSLISLLYLLICCYSCFRFFFSFFSMGFLVSGYGDWECGRKRGVGFGFVSFSYCMRWTLGCHSLFRDAALVTRTRMTVFSMIPVVRSIPLALCFLL